MKIFEYKVTSLELKVSLFSKDSEKKYKTT